MKTALLVIDVQNEYFTGKRPISHREQTLPNILQAMDVARDRGIPVVVIQHSVPNPEAPVFRKGSPGWELVPEIASRPRDLLIEKIFPAVLPARRSKTGCARKKSKKS